MKNLLNFYNNFTGASQLLIKEICNTNSYDKTEQEIGEITYNIIHNERSYSLFPDLEELLTSYENTSTYKLYKENFLAEFKSYQENPSRLYAPVDQYEDIGNFLNSDKVKNFFSSLEKSSQMSRSNPCISNVW